MLKIPSSLLIWTLLTTSLLIHLILIAKEIHGHHHSIKVRIVNGQSAGWMQSNNEVYNPGDFPFMVHLHGVRLIKINGNDYLSTQRCGGAILSLNIIITAAHCIYGIHTKNITIRGGLVHINHPSQESIIQYVTVLNYITHEDFQIRPFVDNDIGLIRTFESFNLTKFVQPIKLPQQDRYKTGIKVKIFGWGLNEDGIRPEWLQKTYLIIFKKSVCEVYSKLEVSDNMICAMNKGLSTVCKGDSGGPLVYEDQIIGIASWIMGERKKSNGKSTCSTNFPAVFVNVYKYLNWIEDNMNLLDIIV